MPSLLRPRDQAGATSAARHPSARALMLSCALLAVAVAAAPRAAAAADCAACTDQALCRPHKNAETDALAAFTAAFSDKRPEQRTAALEELAKINLGHDNHRSAAAATKMAAALRDSDRGVRRRAARLLGETQEPRSAAAVLNAAVKTALVRAAALDPKKDRGTPAYDAEIEDLRALYSGLALTGRRDAAPSFAAGLDVDNADVMLAAAQHCEKAANRDVISAVLRALQKLAHSYASDPVVKAWQVLSALLPRVTGCRTIKPQDDSGDAGRFAADWEEWWKANQKKPEFD
ncbi:MAG: hypothetical protein HZA54_07790 [Planctomycetes bacterium]|nr:hypothetical protein [Planctomycetota bacterium]